MPPNARQTFCLFFCKQGLQYSAGRRPKFKPGPCAFELIHSFCTIIWRVTDWYDLMLKLWFASEYDIFRDAFTHITVALKPLKSD